jgi:hypothetical protein
MKFWNKIIRDKVLLSMVYFVMYLIWYNIFGIELFIVFAFAAITADLNLK